MTAAQSVTERDAPPIEEAARRLFGWMRQHHPGAAFNPGAAAGEIRAAESRMGMAFPADLAACLALANGEAFRSTGVIGNWTLLDLETIVAEYELMNDLAGRGAFGDNANPATPFVKGVWWHSRWIPVVGSGSGHLICVDLDPNASGRTGQIILFLHDAPARYLIAHSLAGWFTRIADDLERGVYTLQEEHGYWRFDNEAFMWSSIEGRDIYGAPPQVTA